MGALGFDFSIFWEAARGVLAGQSPYATQGFFSPFPFLMPIIPFGLLPYQVAFALWTLVNLISLVFLARRRTHMALIFLPVFFALWVGQVDLMIIALAFTGTWWGLALATLKPQLAIWLVPFFVLRWWQQGERRRILLLCSAVVLLYAGPTLVMPSWWGSWMESAPSVFVYSEHASSLFGVSALLSGAVPTFVPFVAVAAGIVVVLIVVRPFTDQTYWNWAAIFNPVANIYSQCILVTQIDWIAVGLSWILLPLSLYLHSGLPWVLVPAYLLWRASRLHDADAMQMA